jgi:hypothetical protein
MTSYVDVMIYDVLKLCESKVLNLYHVCCSILDMNNIIN